MQPADTPLDQPAPAQSRDLAWKVICGILAVVLWSAVAWLTVVSIPKADQLFADFRMRIPLATECIIRFRWAIPVLAVISFAVCFYVRNRWAWFWVLIILPAIINVAIFVSLYLPITNLLEGLRGNTAGWWETFF